MKRNSILLLDDDREILTIYKKIMELNGFEVVTSDNPLKALEIIESQEISVVVSDIIMPKINGIEFLQRAKKINKELEVIMLTAEGSISGAVEAVKQGAFSYFVKPADIDELISSIKKAEEMVNIKEENKNLKEQILSINGEKEFIGYSHAIKELRKKAMIVGETDSAVSITGESGTGKEVLAGLIHASSRRKEQPFICVNCAAFNENLIESELFGSEKGAYTGADRQRKGRFEMANNGTIFFDEIGELSLNMQVKLLRVLQEKTFERVGGTQSIKSDFRLITATNRDLKKAVEENKFREDLYYRINIIPLEIPALRERKEDIPILLQSFLNQISKEMNKKINPVGSDLLRKLMAYNWPGNVRELRNIVERLVVLAVDGDISVLDLPDEIRKNDCSICGEEKGENAEMENTLKAATKMFEKEYIINVLESHNGNVSKAAEEMCIARKNLYKKLNDYGIK